MRVESDVRPPEGELARWRCALGDVPDGAAGGLGDRGSVVRGARIDEDDFIDYDGLLLKSPRQPADVLAFVVGADNRRHSAWRIDLTYCSRATTRQDLTFIRLVRGSSVSCSVPRSSRRRVIHSWSLLPRRGNDGVEWR
jgi:hypothetical protein